MQTKTLRVVISKIVNFSREFESVVRIGRGGVMRGAIGWEGEWRWVVVYRGVANAVGASKGAAAGINIIEGLDGGAGIPSGQGSCLFGGYVVKSRWDGG